jgi:hypothetical protein
MKKHIIWLLVALLLVGLGVWGLKSCDTKVMMPLTGSQQEVEKSEQVKAVESKIKMISNPVTLADEKAVADARTAYDALSAEEKAQVSNYATLQAAEASLAGLKNNQSATTVEELIGKISNPVTLADEKAIVDARAAYDALSAEEKAKVGNYATLQAAETTLAGLKNPSSDKISKGDIVTFVGGNVYKSAKATKASSVIKKESTCKVTLVTGSGTHHYHLVSTDGGGVYGWVDEANIKKGAN